ncbi:hypothetical protein [Microbacterium oxydans]|uniref:hypothetical protein n=1 Tax=Microbacterium oxydans TaxID=82380 RepID=UPI000A65BD1E|nr:hypothetical protein [Microbacterium oxydans]
MDIEVRPAVEFDDVAGVCGTARRPDAARSGEGSEVDEETVNRSTGHGQYTA